MMDLVGVDTGLDVSRSFYEQSLESPLAAVPDHGQDRRRRSPGAQGGRGYYDYGGDSHRDPDPSRPPPVG